MIAAAGYFRYRAGQRDAINALTFCPCLPSSTPALSSQALRLLKRQLLRYTRLSTRTPMSANF